MSLSRISSRFPRIVLAQCRNSLIRNLTGRHHPLPVPSNQFHSLDESSYKGPYSIIRPRTLKPIGPALGGSTVENSGVTAKARGDHAEALEERETPISKDSSKELTMEDLVKLVTLKGKHEEIEKIQDKILRTFADMVNVAERARASGDAEALEKREAPVSEDSSTKELTMEDLVKLVTEKVELLEGKQEEIEKMQGTCTAMMKLVTKREELLKAKQEEIEKSQDNVLNTLVYQVFATWFTLIMLVEIGTHL